MKRLLIASLLGAMTFAAAAQDIPDTATAQPPVAAEASAEAAVALDADADLQAGAEALAEADARRNCVRYTGSRIPRSRMDQSDCVISNGRVYSREDLRRTGQTDIGDALRMLDPAIR